MHNELVYRHERAHRPDARKIALGILGGVLYILMALAVMQIAFRIWLGML